MVGVMLGCIDGVVVGVTVAVGTGIDGTIVGAGGFNMLSLSLLLDDPPQAASARLLTAMASFGKILFIKLPWNYY